MSLRAAKDLKLTIAFGIDCSVACQCWYVHNTDLTRNRSVITNKINFVASKIKQCKDLTQLISIGCSYDLNLLIINIEMSNSRWLRTCSTLTMWCSGSSSHENTISDCFASISVDTVPSREALSPSRFKIRKPENRYNNMSKVLYQARPPIEPATTSDQDPALRTPSRSNKGKSRPTSVATMSADALEASSSYSTATPMEVTTGSCSSTLESASIQPGNQDRNTSQEEPQPQEDGGIVLSQTVITEPEPILSSTETEHGGEKSMAMNIDSDNNPADDDDDPFEISDVEEPDENLSEARATLKGLVDVQEVQLRKLLAVKRHIHQNPNQATKHDARLPDMKKILDARSNKIKELKSIIIA
ncbi:hypothetical protein EC968_008234 [Mortierella alpina]|nr:hypothetical protein EC968_008234 [Mortierella alpina]